MPGCKVYGSSIEPYFCCRRMRKQMFCREEIHTHHTREVVCICSSFHYSGPDFPVNKMASCPREQNWRGCLFYSWLMSSSFWLVSAISCANMGKRLVKSIWLRVVKQPASSCFPSLLMTAGQNRAISLFINVSLLGCLVRQTPLSRTVFVASFFQCKLESLLETSCPFTPGLDPAKYWALGLWLQWDSLWTVKFVLQWFTGMRPAFQDQDKHSPVHRLKPETMQESGPRKT